MLIRSRKVSPRASRCQPSGCTASTNVGLDADPFAEPIYHRWGFKTVGRSPSGSIPGRVDAGPRDLADVGDGALEGEAEQRAPVVAAKLAGVGRAATVVGPIQCPARFSFRRE
jgi:hypothetical protein